MNCCEVPADYEVARSKAHGPIFYPLQWQRSAKNFKWIIQTRSITSFDCQM